MQEKSEKMLEFLRQRELDRRLESSRAKIEEKTENEKIEYFEKIFGEEKNKILGLIEVSENVNSKDRPEHFNTIFNSILTLQKYVAANNIFLRTYDIKIYQNNIHALTQTAKDLEEKLIPKKRFNFKKKSEIKATTNKLVQLKNVTAPKLDVNVCGYKDLTNQKLTLTGKEIYKRDITLTNLNNCTVFIKGAPSTLHLSNLKTCKVFSGPISTSIFTDSCIDSTLVISCQQLRLHSSKNVQIYLHVTSRAIMEDCKDIYLAPYNFKYEGIEKDYEAAGLDRTLNNWTSIDDFNWLKVEKQSPHWGILQECDRVNWDDETLFN